MRTIAVASVLMAIGALATRCGIDFPEPGNTQKPGTATGHVIAGRVVDPHNLQPEAASLRVGVSERDGDFSSVPVELKPDGSFATRPMAAGTYVLEVVRTPHSPTHAATVVGFNVMRLNTADVSDVVVTIQRDTSITGRFRVEGDDPAVAWPPHIHASAALVLDGLPSANSITAEGAPAGRFILRNAWGRRLLRIGYTLPPGATRGFRERVVLDGVDITNVPTDFSAHENSQLEVVLIQQPARRASAPLPMRALPSPESWSKADNDTRRLSPAAFQDLSVPVRAELERRGCTIPQVYTGGAPHNVVRGAFITTGQTDIAVMCSRNRRSTILLFPGGKAAAVIELADRADADFLQMVTTTAIGFSRELSVASPDYIREHHRRHGGPVPPPLDHDGINDMFVEKASIVWYWHGGKWLRLTGAD